MTAMNIVRMRVKPGREQAFLDLHRNRKLSELDGMKSLRVVNTGEREYYVVGEWNSMDAIAAARPAMIGILDEFRGDLEDLGETGVTEPHSGEVAVEL